MVFSRGRIHQVSQKRIVPSIAYSTDFGMVYSTAMVVVYSDAYTAKFRLNIYWVV